MIYLFFMVIEFCRQEIICLKCTLLVAIADLGRVWGLGF